MHSYVNVQSLFVVSYLHLPPPPPPPPLPLPSPSSSFSYFTSPSSPASFPPPPSPLYSLKRPPLREKVSLQEELAVKKAPEFPVLETVAVQTAQEEKKDSYELRVAMMQLSQWTPQLNGVSRNVHMLCVSVVCACCVCLCL